MGISEAFYIPAGLALIADYHTGTTRSRAVGLHQVAIYGGVICGGFGGYLAASPDIGWRYAFEMCGLSGMVYAIPLVALLRDAPKSHVVDQPKPSPLRAARELCSNFSFVLLVLYFTLPALAGWVVRDWMPSILKAQFQIGQGQAGVAATFYWQVAAILGAFLGGLMADRWMQTNVRGRIYVSAIGMTLIVPAIFGVGNASSLTMAVAFLILFGLGWGFFDCNNMPILSQIVRPDGLMNMVSISCGGFADWGFGALRDSKVPLNMIFSLFAGAAIFSIVLVLLIRPRAEF
jgi:sugar phosphate permease